MKRLAAVASAGLAALAALILAAPVSAAITPKLAVTPTNAEEGTVIISGGTTDPAEDAFQRIQIFVPTGFGLNAPVEGAVVGKASAEAVIKDVGPTSEERVAGTIAAVAMSDPAFAFEQSTCDDATHAAVWSMQIPVNDTTRVTIPIFVDKTVGSEEAFGPYKLVMCLRSPDLSQSDPNRSLTGTKIDNFILTLNGFTVPTKAGDYRWRSMWTPYQPGTGTPNTAGSVEAQSVVRVPPGVLSLVGKKVTQTVNGQARALVRLSGKLVVAGEPAGNVTVGFGHGPTKGRLTSFGSVKTDAAGNYLITSRLTRATYFQGGVTLPRQELGPAGCQASFGTSVCCVNASISGFKLLRRMLYVK